MVLLVPMLFDDLWDECTDSPFRSSQVMSKHQVRDPFPGGFLVTFDKKPITCNRETCCRIPRQCKDDESEQKVAENPATDFQISLDVQDFKPEEISVKATDKFVIVEAKHEEKDGEHVYEMNHFVRRYQLPDGHDNGKIASTLSSDGVLTISAPKLKLPKPSKERSIRVKQGDEISKASEQQDESKVDTNFTLEDLNE